MAILSRKITAFLKKVADLPDRPGGTITTTALKEQFDSSPEELRVAHNGLVDDLASTSAGASGAHQIGSESITGVTGNNIHAQISDVKAQINQAVTGQIPPNSITPDKLSFVPVKSTDYTAADVLAKLLTVDGPSSGIDASTVGGFKLRDINGYVEYSTNGGGAWTSVGANAVLVASNTVRESDTTEYLLDTANNRKLIYKLVPKATGEVIITADVKGVQFGSTTGPTDCAASTLTISTADSGNVNIRLANANFDYRTPIGTVLPPANVSPEITVIQSNVNNVYESRTTVLKVNEFQPVYFFFYVPNAPFTASTKAGIKNIQIKYDMIRG